MLHFTMGSKHIVTECLENWNPLLDDHNNYSFNSYDSGPGANLDRSLQLPRRIKPGTNEYHLYVTNIPLDINEDGLENIFSYFGCPYNVKVFHKLGSKTNYGFVSFSTVSEAHNAISKLHMKPPGFLHVTFALSKEERMKRTFEREQYLQSNLRPPYEPAHSNIISYQYGLKPFVGLDTQYLIEECDDEGAVGYDSYSANEYYDNFNDCEIPSLPRLQRTCNKDGWRVVIGRGKSQSSYSFPITSEERRRQIEALVKARVFYDKKSNGTYEYGKDFGENHVGPCTCCGNWTYSACEQCSGWYCTSKCKIRDLSQHRQFCDIDLHISNDGEKRQVVLKKSVDTDDGISTAHDYCNKKENRKIYQYDKYEQCDTDCDCTPKKFNENNNFRQKYKTERLQQDHKHFMSSDKKLDTQMNKMSLANTESQQYTRLNIDRTDKFHNRGNKSEWGNKNKFNDKKKELSSRNDRPNKSNSVDIHRPYGNNEAEITDCSKLQGTDQDNVLQVTDKAQLLDMEKGCELACVGKESRLQPTAGDQQNESISIKAKPFLPSDIFTEVTISYITENGQFWVQKSVDFDVIKHMTQELNKVIEDVPAFTTPTEKSKCAAEYEGNWFRARVVTVNPLTVLFVDWGNTEELSGINDIRVLPLQFCDIRPMACLICLADRTPSEYIRKKESDTLNVKPISKASDGAIVVQVEGVKYEDGDCPEQDCAKLKPDPINEITQKPVEFYPTEDLELNSAIELKPDPINEITQKPVEFYLTEDLELNSAIEVTKCRYEEPFLWVVLKTRTEQLLALIQTLQSAATKSNMFTPSINDLCLAGHGTVWYRGCVKKLNPLEVFFFDLGQTVECTEDNIRELPIQFHRYPPAFAYKLLAEGTLNEGHKNIQGDDLTVKPVSKRDDGSWLVHVMGEDYSNISADGSMLTSKTDSNNGLLLSDSYTEVLLVAQKSEDIFYVQPLNKTMLNTLNEMTELLHSLPKRKDFRPHIGTVCASLYEDVWSRCRVISISSEITSVYYIDYGNTEENVPFERIQPLPEKYIIIPPQAVPVKVVQEMCDETLDLYNPYFVKPISELPDGTAVVYIRKYFNMEEKKEEKITGSTAAHQEKCLSNEGMRLQSIELQPNSSVKITCIYNASAIYVQPADKKSMCAVEEILQDLGSYCKIASVIDRRPSVGDLVACRYANDMNWYRAKIFRNDEDKFHVLFIDYGNKAIVAIDDMKTLPEKYKSAPAYCVKVGLADCGDTELTPAAQHFLFGCIQQVLVIDFYNDDLSAVVLKKADGIVLNCKLKEYMIPAWKKALLAKEDPTGGKLFVMEDLESVTLPQDRLVTLKTLLYCEPNIFIMCNANTDLYKYVTTTLTNEISDYCNSLPEENHNPRENELCCVTTPGKESQESRTSTEFDENTSKKVSRKWYRGVCLCVGIKTSMVSLVDFGAQFYTPHSCIRRFVPDFISTPAMACFCSMKGIPKQPSDKLIERMKSLVQQNKFFEVRVIDKEEYNSFNVDIPYIINILNKENLI